MNSHGTPLRLARFARALRRCRLTWHFVHAGTALLVNLSRATAHPEATEVLTALSHAIEGGDVRPDLFYARALELRALGRIEEAITDLERTVERDHSLVPAWKDLARLQATLGDYDRAARTIVEAREIARAAAPRMLAGVLIAHGEILLCQGKHRDGLAACREAFDLAIRIPPDWIVVRSRAERACGLKDDALKTMEKNRPNPGGPADPFLVDALIDAGKTGPALELIGRELAAAPATPLWLIKRAQARLPNDRGRAEADLEKAVTALNAATTAAPKEPNLLALRARAFSLLGEAGQAACDLAVARGRGLDLMQILEIEQLLRNRSVAGPSKQDQ